MVVVEVEIVVEVEEVEMIWAGGRPGRAPIGHGRVGEGVAQETQG